MSNTISVSSGSLRGGAHTTQQARNLAFECHVPSWSSGSLPIFWSEVVAMNWGVHVGLCGLDPALTCWRCLQEPVPQQDDHIGLCDECIAALREAEPAFR